MRRLFIIFEWLSIYSLVIAYIWLWENHFSFLVFTPMIAALISWKIRGYTIKTIGLVPISCTNGVWFMLFLLFLMYWSAITLTGYKWNPFFLRQENLGYRFTQSFLEYLPKALFQQIWMNGYFSNRVRLTTGNKTLTAILIGVLFACIHIPNPPLIIATFFGGILSAYFFFKTKNNYVIGIVHALIAVSIMYFLPESWHHNLRIGPGYNNWH